MPRLSCRITDNEHDLITEAAKVYSRRRDKTTFVLETLLPKCRELLGDDKYDEIMGVTTANREEEPTCHSSA